MARGKMTSLFRLLACTVVAVVMMSLAGCSSTKHVPQGSYLLDKVDIKFKGDVPEVTAKELNNYLRQVPNHKILGFWKLQLATYSLSGKDSTKWYNKWLRRMGQAPVIYNDAMTDASKRQLELALLNRGYMDAVVEVDTFPRPDKRKMNVVYTIDAGEPHRIASVAQEIPDTAMAALINKSADMTQITPGSRFDRDALDEERSRVARIMRNNGYFDFTKESVMFYADTVARSKDVDLTLVIKPLERNDTVEDHVPYEIRDVVFVTNYKQGQTLQEAISAATDTVRYKGMEFLYDKYKWMAPGTLYENCFIMPGQPYHAFEIDRTYEYMTRLGMIRSLNIDIQPVGQIGGKKYLDAYILLSPARRQSMSFDVEGTNSEGNLGFGVGVTYQHRNLGHRSRLLTVKFKAKYESISGNIKGLLSNNYQEYVGEVGLTFPKFEFPFISSSFRKTVKASTEALATFNYQRRPEYTRIIAGATWRYKWGDRNNMTRSILDLININYVYLPQKTKEFIEQITPTNPLIRYSYEDHFIVDVAYSYYLTNRRPISSSSKKSKFRQPHLYTFRASIEEAGNLMYGLANLFAKKPADGVYKLFGLAWSQYVKAEVNYSYIRNFSERHTLAFRVGAGIGIPYGNSSVLPFEKRFYAGGANGVRGWSVRRLGPGTYPSTNTTSDFINQCGDISLILTAEYRAKLFWVIEGALFVDAGNIWTIRNYENQPGGLFKFDTFWKEIAASYGLGLRFDFTYFLLRFDLGFKAYNPGKDEEHWPIIHPNWKRDATFHFAVGYPF